MSNVAQILEDTKERLRKELPDQEFFFLLMPMDRDIAALLGTEALEQVQHRVVQHLQKEINEALVDQRESYGR